MSIVFKTIEFHDGRNFDCKLSVREGRSYGRDCPPDPETVELVSAVCLETDELATEEELIEIANCNNWE